MRLHCRSPTLRAIAFVGLTSLGCVANDTGGHINANVPGQVQSRTVMAEPIQGTQYRSGDEIPLQDFGRARVEGWSVFLEPNPGLAATLLPGESYDFALAAPNRPVQGSINSKRYEAGPAGTQFPLSTLMYSIPKVDASDSPAIAYLQMRHTPGPASSRTAEVNKFPIRLDYHAFGPPGTKVASIISEVPLQEEQFLAVYRIQETFSNFISREPYTSQTLAVPSPAAMPPLIYVLRPDSPIGINGAYLPSMDEIRLYSGLFSSPPFPDSGNLYAFHELAHYLFGRAFNQCPGQVEEFIILFSFLRGCTDFPSSFHSTPEILERVERDVRFRIFDESTYLPPGNSDFGHPYDDSSELFASTLTVLNRFPDRFLELFEQERNLDMAERRAMRGIVLSTLSILEAMDGGRHQIHTIVPAYGRLKAELTSP